MAYIGDMGIDANKEIERMEEYQPLPAGRYTAIVETSNIKPTKAGNGRYLELVFRIVDGEYDGRKIWQRYNIDNPNPTATEIAKAELARLCRAVGILRLMDSEELHGIPLGITVIIEIREGRRWNKITDYSHVNVGQAPIKTPAKTNEDMPF